MNNYKKTSLILSAMIIIVTIIPTTLSSSALGYSPSNSELEFLESHISLRVHQCEIQTDELALQTCYTDIMDLINLCVNYNSDRIIGACNMAMDYIVSTHR